MYYGFDNKSKYFKRETEVKDFFLLQRLSSAARMSAGLRKILDATVTHVLSRKVHGNPLATYDLVKSKLSDCATHLYALESATYMAAGLSDYQVKFNYQLKSDISSI